MMGVGGWVGVGGSYTTGQLCVVLLFLLVLARGRYWTNGQVAGDLTRHDADITALYDENTNTQYTLRFIVECIAMQ